MDISKYFSSGYLILLFFILASGIFILLYIFRKYIPLLLPGKMKTDRFRKYYSIAEGLIWGILLLLAAFFFLKTNIIFSGILFLVLFILAYWYSRFALRDYVAGLVFKVENKFSINDIIEANGQKGEIKHFHNRNIEIENENGKMILIPYTLLLGIVSSPQKINETILNFSFEITIPAEKPFEMVSDIFRRHILSLPWSVIKNEPRIQLLKEIDKSFIIKITIFSFDEAYFQPMRKRIEEYSNQQFSTGN